MGAVGRHHSPAALPPGKIRYPLYRRLGGPHGRSGRVRKISPPPELDPRTVQPVASRYTDWAIPAHSVLQCRNICLWRKAWNPLLVESRIPEPSNLKPHRQQPNCYVKTSVLWGNNFYVPTTEPRFYSWRQTRCTKRLHCCLWGGSC